MAVCASGSIHSLFLDQQGCVWSCGSNESGQLGLGVFTNQHTPQKINNLPPIVSVSAGGHYSLFVDINGRVWSCGSNTYGQLGLGDTNDRYITEPITYLPKITSAIALGAASIFLDCEGSVWTSGCNSNGQLGLSDTTHRNQAETIQGLPKIKSIAGGWRHSLLLDCEGSVWVCGFNQYGQLGLGDTIQRYYPERVDRLSRSKSKIKRLPKIKSVAGGVHFSMFLDKLGNVWSCGANEEGELGRERDWYPSDFPQKIIGLPPIFMVAGGNRHYSVFLDIYGNIYTSGKNNRGQFGLGDTENRQHKPKRVKNIPPMCYISSCHPAVNYLQLVDWKGRVWSSGKNDRGQLGLGHTYATLTLQMIETIPTLKSPLKTPEMLSEAQIFKFIEIEQSEQLMKKLKGNIIPLHEVNKEQAKQKIIEGVIGMADWSSKWKDIHAKNQQLNQCIQQHKAHLNKKQQQLDKLTQEMRNQTST